MCSSDLDKKGYNGGQAGWGHVSDIKGIHRQLQDIHDSILQQGEWAKPAQLKAVKEEVESDDAHFAKQSKKMQDAINLHLRKGKSYKDAVAAAKVHVKEEVELEERSLSTDEMGKREDIVKGMKKNLSGFKSKYGKDAKAVMYATATKLAKEEVETEEDIDTSLLELWLTLDQGDRNQLSEMIERGLEEEIVNFISEVDNG